MGVAANEMYAKSFIELSEAQKVDVLLAMVEAANETSGALGQAAREADSWTNVIGELHESWKQFLATLGEPILKILTPMIQGITASLQEMSQTASSAELASGLTEFKESISGIDAEFEEAGAAIEKNAIMADLYRQRLEELEAAGLDTAASQREYANIIQSLNGLYPGLNLQISEQTGLLDDHSKAQLNNLDAMKKRAVYEAQAKKYAAALEAQANAIVEVQAAEKALLDVQTERQALEQQLMELTGYSAEQLTCLYGNRSLAVHDLTREELALMEVIVKLMGEEKALQIGIEEGITNLPEPSAESDAATLKTVMSKSGGAKLLWTNSRPTSSFATQSITISGLSDYDIKIIEFLIGTNIQTELSGAAQTEIIFSGKKLITIPIGMASRFAEVSGNIIRFSDAFVDTNLTVDNTFLIPKKIYGIKVTA